MLLVLRIQLSIKTNDYCVSEFFFNVTDKKNIQMADLQGNEMQFIQIKLLVQTAYTQR